LNRAQNMSLRACDLDGYQLNGAREELCSEQRNGCDLERLQEVAQLAACFVGAMNVPCTEKRLRSNRHAKTF
jgi:hypothetical protein